MHNTEVRANGASLVPQNFGRSEVLNQFLALVPSLLCDGVGTGAKTSILIAVVGGSEWDPEVVALQNVGFDCEAHTFGIESSEIYVDLNAPPIEFPSPKFDLVLCSQVAEHVWNHRTFFGWMTHFTRPGALLWLNCPAINRPHASPEYYSAGFTDLYLANNLQAAGFEVLSHGLIGSERLYFASLTSEWWLSVAEHSHPLRYVGQGGSRWDDVKFYARTLPTRIQLLFRSSTLRSDIQFATESYVLARAPRLPKR